MGWTGSSSVPPRMPCPSPARPGKRYFHASRSSTGETGWRPQLSLPLQLRERPQLFCSFSGLILLFVVSSLVRENIPEPGYLPSRSTRRHGSQRKGSCLSEAAFSSDISFQATAALLPRCPSPVPAAAFHARRTGKEPAPTSLVGTAGAASHRAPIVRTAQSSLTKRASPFLSRYPLFFQINRRAQPSTLRGLLHLWRAAISVCSAGKQWFVPRCDKRRVRLAPGCLGGLRLVYDLFFPGKKSTHPCWHPQGEQGECGEDPIILRFLR